MAIVALAVVFVEDVPLGTVVCPKLQLANKDSIKKTLINLGSIALFFSLTVRPRLYFSVI